MPTDEVWDLGEEQREEAAIKKLDKLIELVVSMRATWIVSPLGSAPWKAGRHLGPLEGNISVIEAAAPARALAASGRPLFGACSRTWIAILRFRILI